MGKVTCPECDKSFKTESGLAWHVEHVHEAEVAEPESQAEGLDRSTEQATTSPSEPEQRPGELESRLEKLERVTGLRESEPDNLFAESTLPEQVTKLAGEVEHARVSEGKADADRDSFNKQLEELQRKSEDELNSLAAVVNIHRDSFNRDLTALESRIDKVQEIVNKLHVCPDCGRSLHLHRVGEAGLSLEEGKAVVKEGSWHLECLHCGYYSVNYKYPKWKEKGTELFAAKQGVKE